MAFPMDERRRQRMTVAVEYDCRGERAMKTFVTAQQAKAFYVRMDRAGRNPRVVSAAG